MNKSRTRFVEIISKDGNGKRSRSDEEIVYGCFLVMVIMAEAKATCT